MKLRIFTTSRDRRSGDTVLVPRAVLAERIYRSRSRHEAGEKTRTLHHNRIARYQILAGRPTYASLPPSSFDLRFGRAKQQNPSSVNPNRPALCPVRFSSKPYANVPTIRHPLTTGEEGPELLKVGGDPRRIRLLSTQFGTFSRPVALESIKATCERGFWFGGAGTHQTGTGLVRCDRLERQQ